MHVQVMLSIGELRTVVVALYLLAELGPVSRDGELGRGLTDEDLAALAERLELEELVLY
jgi:hypothetical protein